MTEDFEKSPRELRADLIEWGKTFLEDYKYLQEMGPEALKYCGKNRSGSN
jgi:hypothetical protein